VGCLGFFVRSAELIICGGHQAIDFAYFGRIPIGGSFFTPSPPSLLALLLEHHLHLPAELPVARAAFVLRLARVPSFAL